jgi:hypothetical protein
MLLNRLRQQAFYPSRNPAFVVTALSMACFKLGRMRIFSTLNRVSTIIACAPEGMADGGECLVGYARNLPLSKEMAKNLQSFGSG